MGIDNWPWTIDESSVDENAPAGAPLTLRDILGYKIRVASPDVQITPDEMPGRVTFHVDDAYVIKRIRVEKKKGT